MIIFLADGRLGNQIFQYAFLKNIQKNNETIVVSGFEELKKVFTIDDVINLNKNNKLIRACLLRICKPIFKYLANKNIISSISVNYEQVLKIYRRETTNYTNKKGFFNFITFVKLGFFQSEKFFDKKIIKSLQIKKKYLTKADDFLCYIQKQSHKIFIHIRREDYKNYSVYGKSALLPIDYYKKQIKWFMQNRQDCFFVFLSDEPEFIEKEFKYIKNKLISTNNSVEIDFAIMTKCHSAILSPSSFGWWGSYLMQDRDVVFAPKYWLGFNSKIDYHKNSLPEYIKSVNI